MSGAITLKHAEAYVTRGLVYEAGVFDCGSLAVLVQRELFGRNIRLPGASQRAKGRRGQARDIACQQLAARIEAPVTGCCALFWQTTDAGAPPLNRHWHVGTVFLHLGETWVLHASNEARGVTLRRLSDLTRQGMHLEGFYRWN